MPARLLWSFLLLLGGCSSSAPPLAEPTAPVTPPSASTAPERPAFCEGYDLLLRIEGQRADLQGGVEIPRTEAELDRQGALRVLSEEFGDHPAGVAMGIDTLLKTPLAPETNPNDASIVESLESIRGYVGPICSG